MYQIFPKFTFERQGRIDIYTLECIILLIYLVWKFYKSNHFFMLKNFFIFNPWTNLTVLYFIANKTQEYDWIIFVDAQVLISICPNSIGRCLLNREWMIYMPKIYNDTHTHTHTHTHTQTHTHCTRDLQVAEDNHRTQNCLCQCRTAFSDDLILLYFAEYSISSYMSKLETRGKKRPRPELASSYLKKRKFKIVRFKWSSERCLCHVDETRQDENCPTQNRWKKYNLFCRMDFQTEITHRINWKYIPSIKYI